MKSHIYIPKKHKIDILVLSIVIFLRIAYFVFCNEIVRTLDSAEYIKVNGFSCVLGNLDRYRLPVYPLLIDISSKLFGAYYLHAMCFAQLLVSLVSTVAMYHMLKKLSDRSYIYLTITAFYCISPAVIGWDKVVLTESFSLSFTIFMLWGLVFYLKEEKLRYIIVAIAASGIGAFLRAVFAIYTGVIFGFLIVRLIFADKKDKGAKRIQRISDVKALSIAIIPVILLVGYGARFYSQYGAFTLSDSGLGQQLSIVLQNGYYEDSSDEEIKNTVNDILNGKALDYYDKSIETLIYDIYGEDLSSEQKQQIKESITAYISEDDLIEQKYIDNLNLFFSELYGGEQDAIAYDRVYCARCYIMNNFDRDRINDFISEAKAANMKDYLFSLRHGTFTYFSSPYERTSGGVISLLLRAFIKRIIPSINIYLLQGLLVGFVEIVIYAIILIKKKYSSWMHLGFAIMILVTGMLSVLGTNAEFARTAITMFPMLFVVFGIWANRIIDVIGKRTLQTNIDISKDNELAGHEKEVLSI